MHDAVAAVSRLATERDKLRRKANFYEGLLEDMVDAMDSFDGDGVQDVLHRFVAAKDGFIK